MSEAESPAEKSASKQKESEKESETLVLDERGLKIRFQTTFWRKGRGLKPRCQTTFSDRILEERGL